MKPFNDLLQLAQKAAIEAGLKILQIYQQDFEVAYKLDNSPLTLADQLANDVIMSYLESTQIPIISEENSQIAYEERKDWEMFWLVDPLDGTKEFIKKNDEFTVNIALIAQGEPVLGVIYWPVAKTLYYNDMQAAYRVEGVEDVATLEEHKRCILQSKKVSKQLKVAISSSHFSKESFNCIEQVRTWGNFESVETQSFGSSLKLCRVAEGAVDMYPRLSPTMEWDIAAGHAICLKAGVEVVDIHTHSPLQYNKTNLLNPFFLVGTPAIIQLYHQNKLNG